MALIVEDGTGLAGAESFISVANASAYHTARGNAAWAALASDTIREQCLRKATDYMEQAFRLRWAGYRTTVTQALSWPRGDVPIPDSPGLLAGYPGYLDDDVVPDAVENACAELALKASSATLFDDQSRAVLREKIGPLETEYDPYSAQDVRYKAVEGMLRPYFTGGNGITLVRV